MKFVSVSGDLRVLGKNEAIRLLVEKHRRTEIALRVCEESQVRQSLERGREFLRGKLAEYLGVPLEV
jgi:hypothetical protein